jgi:hypothetical protein
MIRIDPGKVQYGSPALSLILQIPLNLRPVWIGTIYQICQVRLESPVGPVTEVQKQTVPRKWSTDQA